ncbi:MAG: uncharacterized protein JWM53_626 [bacterium]|nr:uncharacterized protein [bacterium]
MIDLRFHRDVYNGNAVDEAVKTFANFATFELREEPQHWIVRLSCPTVDREKRVAGELGNYALGLTVRNREVRR